MMLKLLLNHIIKKGNLTVIHANGKTKIKGNFTLGAADSTFEAYYFNIKKLSLQ